MAAGQSQDDQPNEVLSPCNGSIVDGIGVSIDCYISPLTDRGSTIIKQLRFFPLLKKVHKFKLAVHPTPDSARLMACQ